MKILNFEIEGFFIFLFFLFLSLVPQISEFFGETLVNNSTIFVFVISFIIMAGSVYIDKAKIRQRKIIGRQIHSSVDSSEILPLSSGFVAIGLGAYRSDYIGNSKGKDGILIVHKDLIYEVDGNVLFYGDVIHVEQFQIRRNWQTKILDHFSFTPEMYYFARIIENRIKTFSPDKIASVTSLNDEIQSISQQNQFLTATLKEITGTVGNVIDKASSYTRTSIDSVKKQTKEINKE